MESDLRVGDVFRGGSGRELTVIEVTRTGIRVRPGDGEQPFWIYVHGPVEMIRRGAESTPATLGPAIEAAVLRLREMHERAESARVDANWMRDAADSHLRAAARLAYEAELERESASDAEAKVEAMTAQWMALLDEEREAKTRLIEIVLGVSK